MQVVNYVLGKWFDNSRAIHKLAIENHKYCALAEKIISAKNISANEALLKSRINTGKSKALNDKMFNYKFMLGNIQKIKEGKAYLSSFKVAFNPEPFIK